MKLLKKLGLFLLIYILLGMSAYIAIECSWICLPVSIILGAAGLLGVEYYADHYFNFNKTWWDDKKDK